MSLVTPIDNNLDLLSGKLSIILFERELLAQGGVPFAAHTSAASWFNMVPSRRTRIARRYIDEIARMAGTGALPYMLFDTKYPDSTVFRGAMEREGRHRFFRWWGTMDSYVIAATRELWRFLGEPLDQMRR